MKNFIVDYTNDIIKEYFEGDNERHQHSSFEDWVCNQLGTTPKDCVRHQKIHFQTS